jgi:hypothetical protein
VSGQHSYLGGWRTPPQSNDPWTTALVILMLALVVFGGACLLGAWNEWLYGDWRCAFAHCRLSK